MRRIVAMLIAGAFVVAGASGCVMHTRPAHRHTTVVYKERPSCRPSHYWDGEQCRHKGNGHGARKHDY